MRRRGMLLCGLAGLVGGCCGVAPPQASKFFERASPTETLKGFVYAIDTHQWDFAYESLTRASRAQYGPLKFEVAIRFLKDPVLGEVSVYDLISSSVLHRGHEKIAGDRASIVVVPRAPDSEGRPVRYRLDLHFVREEGEWRLDFDETLNAIQQALPPPEAASAR